MSLTPRQRKQRRVRKKVQGSTVRPRLSVYKSSQHIYAQVISDENGKTLASASTLDKEVVDQIGSVSAEEVGTTSPSKSTKSAAAAYAVGLVVARRAAGGNIKEVVFDRNGFVYHGRVKAVADGARKGG
ncbi:MAG: 50S ribosomal protein L18, partial [Proteobacteria bacterium]